MKSLITIISLLLSVTLFASNGEINLDMKLSINDKIVASPSIITVNGMPASITSESEDGGFEINVTPTLKENQIVYLEMKVYEIEKGIKKLISSPIIETVLGEEAILTTEKTDGDYEKMELVVNPSI